MLKDSSLSHLLVDSAYPTRPRSSPTCLFHISPGISYTAHKTPPRSTTACWGHFVMLLRVFTASCWVGQLLLIHLGKYWLPSQNNISPIKIKSSESPRSARATVKARGWTGGNKERRDMRLICRELQDGWCDSGLCFLWDPQFCSGLSLYSCLKSDSPPRMLKHPKMSVVSWPWQR